MELLGVLLYHIEQRGQWTSDCVYTYLQISMQDRYILFTMLGIPPSRDVAIPLSDIPFWLR